MCSSDLVFDIMADCTSTESDDLMAFFACYSMQIAGICTHQSPPLLVLQQLGPHAAAALSRETKAH
jgi:hypothetical protein